MDHLDLLCGINQGGGPHLLLHSSQVPNMAAATMADEIFITQKTVGLNITELTSIITEALNTTLPVEPSSESHSDYDSDSDTEHIPNTDYQWIPEGLGQWGRVHNLCCDWKI